MLPSKPSFWDLLFVFLIGGTQRKVEGKGVHWVGGESEGQIWRAQIIMDKVKEGVKNLLKAVAIEE